MNTEELLKVLKHDPFSTRFDYSVLPLNHFLEKRFNTSSLVVVNLDDCDEPGSHWVALSIDNSGDVEYFDSYGILPFYSSVMTKLQKLSLNRKLGFNLTCFQGNSSVCGQYCLLYLLLKSRGFSLKEIQHILCKTETTTERDFVVNQFINFTFGKLFVSPLKVYDNFL